MFTQKRLASVFLALFLFSGCASPKKGGVGTQSEASLAADFEKNAGDRVYFAFDSAALHHHSKAALEAQGRWIHSHPNVKVVIEGHCDERGTREYNLALGEKRADSVKRFLIHHGIADSKIETISYGKEHPAVIGNDEEAYAKNRRAVTVIKE